jgi:hypothetical protein
MERVIGNVSFMPKPASVLQLGKLQTTHKVPTHGVPSPFTHAVQNKLDAAFHYRWIGGGGGGASILPSRETIQNKPQIFVVCQNMMHHCSACNEASCHHFEQLL